MNDAPADYRTTVFLPRTDFPMRGDLPKREPALLRRWQEMGLFQRLRAEAKGRPPFILHDGPPYANGNLHIGHALNKIHKDVINRARQMAGFDADYVPGWDCHGLPIEWKIEEQYRKKGRDKDQVPILDFRAECRAYAAHWMAVQSEEFQRLGIEGDWAHPYATMDFASEAAIAAEIYKFLPKEENAKIVKDGALYRGLRPVLWSPVEKTALAEAEVEYQDREDTAIWVRFVVSNTGTFAGTPPLMDFIGTSIVIWTTTPWTIPGNRAIAFGPSLNYTWFEVVSVKENSLAHVGERLIVATNLLDKFCVDVGIVDLSVIRTINGRDQSFGSYDDLEFKNLLCHPPLRLLMEAGSPYRHYHVPLLPGDFVTDDSGTGFVHIAPAHGEDDFYLCEKYRISVPETVQDDGFYTPDVPIFGPKHIHVYKAADPVCNALKDAGALLKREEFRHSYPHSWRSKAPLIYLARPNWFIRMDEPEGIRGKALDAIDETKFIPEQGRNRIRSMVESRPDWCISRQRAWGVPIAIFVRKSDKSILADPTVLARTIDIFKTEGADAWYARPAQDFLGNDHDADDYEQIKDIVDVWFESGSTHAFVLEARGMPWPADLYLEGSDQHRGWFQASLLEAIGTRGQAPFKAIVTDGFVLDEQGRKMSKSLGNVTAPQTVIDQYGADILRLWVMNSDIHNDLRIGPDILKQQADLYRRLRNTLRWILGGLDGFTEAERIEPHSMPQLERLMLHRLAELDALVRQAIASHDWTGVYPAIHQFCAADLSAFYFDIRKDALYCDPAGSPTRRACRTTLDILHRCLTLWLAPVLPFTAEEAWLSRFGDDGAGSVHLQPFFPVPPEWRNDALAGDWARIREIRTAITGEIEAMRQQKTIGSSLGADALVDDDALALLDLEEWAEAAIVSAARPAERQGALPARGAKCARCWRVLPEVGESLAHPALCRRCCEAVS